RKDGYKLTFTKYGSVLDLYVEEVYGNQIKYRISFSPSEIVKSIVKQLNWYKLLTYFCQGQDFIVYTELSSEGIFFKGNPLATKEFISSMEMFESILNIERYFRIKFGPISYEDIFKGFPEIRKLNLLIQYYYYNIT